MPFSLSVRNVIVAMMLALTVLAAGCARQQKGLEAGMGGGGVATPGSPQDFQVNVGDRVFFETDSSSLTPQSTATLDRQVQWLNQYPRYAFTKQEGGSFKIGVLRPDGSGERILTEGFHNEGPTWAPNGRVLMFFRDTGGANGGPQLWSVDITGYNEQIVPTPSFASDPAWSPLLS